MIRRHVARFLWSLSGWTMVNHPSPTGPTVFLGAPHTSNWDFPITLGIAWQLEMDVKWLGKKSLFRGPLGPVARALGGVSVDRENPRGLVDEMVRAMKDGDMVGLVIAPDGTRSGNTHWKSGFYRIAREAGLPVTLGYVDRSTKTAGIGPTIHLTGNVAADMDVIRAFYADKSGFHPEQRVEPRLRDESGMAEVA